MGRTKKKEHTLGDDSLFSLKPLNFDLGDE